MTSPTRAATRIRLSAASTARPTAADQRPRAAEHAASSRLDAGRPEPTAEHGDLDQHLGQPPTRRAAPNIRLMPLTRLRCSNFGLNRLVASSARPGRRRRRGRHHHARRAGQQHRRVRAPRPSRGTEHLHRAAAGPGDHARGSRVISVSQAPRSRSTVIGARQLNEQHRQPRGRRPRCGRPAPPGAPPCAACAVGFSVFSLVTRPPLTPADRRMAAPSRDVGQTVLTAPGSRPTATAARQQREQDLDREAHARRRSASGTARLTRPSASSARNRTTTTGARDLQRGGEEHARRRRGPSVEHQPRSSGAAGTPRTTP